MRGFWPGIGPKKVLFLDFLPSWFTIKKNIHLNILPKKKKFTVS